MSGSRPSTFFARPISRRPPAPRLYPDRSTPFSPALWHWGAYVALFVTVLLASYQAMWLWRASLDRILGIVLWRQPALPAIYLAANTIIAILLFMIVIWSESHLRGALATTYYPPGSYFLNLLKRYGQVWLILVPIILIPVVLQEWAFRALT